MGAAPTPLAPRESGEHRDHGAHERAAGDHVVESGFIAPQAEHGVTVDRVLALDAGEQRLWSLVAAASATLSVGYPQCSCVVPAERQGLWVN